MTPSPDTPEPMSDSRQRALLAHAILIGLTPLIPVPLADDLAKGHLRRRLVRLLAQAHGLDPGADDVEALAREQDSGGGCLVGCLGQALLYPLKRIFRKIFFFLEWKRAVDLTSYTYHWGYLLDYALGEGLLEKTPTAASSDAARPSVDDLRAAIERACREAPIKPLERAVGAALRQARGALLSAARRMRTGPAETATGPPPAAAPEPEVEASEVGAVSGVAAHLQQRIASAVPEAHFRELRSRFRAHLEEAAALRRGQAR